MRPRLLVLTPRFPYPVAGGDVLRIERMCSALARDWDLTLLSFAEDVDAATGALPADHPFRRVHLVPLPRWRSYAQALMAVLTGGPLQLGYYRSPAFAAQVRLLAPQHDAVLCHLLRTAPYGAEFPGARFLELTDHLPLTYRRTSALRSTTASLKGLAYRLEARRLESAQIRWASSFDVVSFVSDVDRDLFQATRPAPGSSVKVFGNGVSQPAGLPPLDPASCKLVFVGNMHSLPNADAVRFVLDEILPGLIAADPRIRLKLVGRIPDDLRRTAQRHDHVEIVGAVDSIGDALADCAVGLCPVRIAAGIQNKLLEYMAHGVPAVTSPMGAEGMAGTAGKHYLVASSTSDWLTHITMLLDDSRQRDVLRGHAWQLVQSRYTWDSCLGELSGTYRDALARADVEKRRSGS